MEGPPLGPGGEDITWPDQVAPRGRKASSTRKIKPQTSNPKRRVRESWGGGLGPPTHAPPTVRHDARGRATSRGRECGDNERGGEPAASQPANH